MSSPCLDFTRWLARSLACLTLAACTVAHADAPSDTLRVCLEPDNLPYSRASLPGTDHGSPARRDVDGFEWRIARLLADALNTTLEVHWLPLRRGMVRKTFGEGHCEVMVGVPAGLERVLTTRPYYRSSYVFVTRALDGRPLQRFDDPRLPDLRIGVQLIGNDLAATPPGHALARHGAIQGVRGYTVYGDGPASERMLRALARGELDAALVWGPQAGYFVRHAAVPLQMSQALPPNDLASMPFEFAIAVGVRQGEAALRDRLQTALDARRPEVDAILAEFAVPRTDQPDWARP
ncbi:MAG: quinoprotein dehydrogenase-associated putative ABC transporter substrate-binding protein [Rubrivivax sp.]|nr:MAG: quinoprotein dehydrogenase-associated putative ABC transporter substrate-binding protein [Rubrivivax sp.]